MPTLTLDGPRSDPSLTGPTDPFTPPPQTRVAPRPAPVSPSPPQPVRTRRRGRSLALLVGFAVAGVATGGTLAWFGVRLPSRAVESPPTVRAAMRAIRAFGDYTTAPREDSVQVSVPGRGGLCDLLLPIFSCGDNGDVTYRARGAVDATVPIRRIQRLDVTVRRRTVVVHVPSAELGEAVVYRDSIVPLDDTSADVSDREIAAQAADELTSRARDAGLPGEAQRVVRRLLVHRLHAMGFVHARVFFV